MEKWGTGTVSLAIAIGTDGLGTAQPLRELAGIHDPLVVGHSETGLDEIGFSDNCYSLKKFNTILISVVVKVK